MRISSLEAINQFSARWAALTPSGGPTVFSAACAWPLLALLAAAASGPVRQDLSKALGVRPESAHDLAVELLSALPGLPGVWAALGLWSRGELPLRPQWTQSLPPGVAERLTGDLKADKERLDAWASEHTSGLIPRMPVEVMPSTVLVLATALALKTRWVDGFTDTPLTLREGPWARARRPVAGLRRTTGNLDDVTVLDTPAGPITHLSLKGHNGLDVHLVIGSPDRPAAEILSAVMTATGATTGTAGITGTADTTRHSAAGMTRPSGLAGSQLPLGANAPGLTVEETLGRDPYPELAVQTVRFTVRAEHDLLASPLFGLQAAAGPGEHFPGISPDELRVSEARQGAMAVFSSTGFEAAAVTAVAMTRAAFVEPDQRRKTVRVTFDRPFGFYATHRESGLILAAGWVTEPD